MKRYRADNLNTEKKWNTYWSMTPDSAHPDKASWQVYGNPCLDVAKILKIFHVDSFIDVGCGRGPYFQFVDAVNKYGCDLSEEAIKNLPEGVIGKVVNITGGLPYDDNSFDLVYSGETLEHIEDPDTLVKQLYRICKKDGFVVINTPFEDKIPDVTHLWFIYETDLHEFFKDFKWHIILRFRNGAEWEHFCCIAKK